MKFHKNVIRFISKSLPIEAIIAAVLTIPPNLIASQPVLLSIVIVLPPNQTGDRSLATFRARSPENAEPNSAAKSPSYANDLTSSPYCNAKH
jgi:hypothetical protein